MLVCSGSEPLFSFSNNPLTMRGCQLLEIAVVAVIGACIICPSKGFPLQTMKSKMDENINSQKSKNGLRGYPSGGCGSGLIWELNTDTGILNITKKTEGSGEMDGYSNQNPPWYPFRKTINTIVVNENVSSIGAWAFVSCSNLTSITLSNTVKNIGDKAFYYCRALTSIRFPNSVENMGSWTFQGCSSLTEVIIPDSVTAIHSGTFSDCRQLESITIPASVNHIGSGAFGGCTALSHVCYLGTKDPKGDGSTGFFDSCPSDQVYVPMGYDGETFCEKSVIRKEECPIFPPIPPAHDDKVFKDCDSLGNVSVPDKYKGSDFCGHPTDQVIKLGFFKTYNWAVVAGIISIINFVMAIVRCLVIR